MGVPKFFAWLIKNYKKDKIVFQKEKEDVESIKKEIEAAGGKITVK